MFMKMKCLACHEFRLAKRQCRVFCTKLHLLDVGRIKEALELEEGLASVARMAGAGRLDTIATNTANNKNNNKHEMVVASALAIDDYLDSMLALRPPPHSHTSASTVASSSASSHDALDDDTNNAAAAGTNCSLTFHERAARRIVLKEFQSACTKALKCANCSAFSPKVRHDQYNKIFMMPLAARNKKANLAERVRIRSACGIVGSIGGTFYDGEGDEDDDWPDSEDEVEMHADDDDDEESEEDDDDVEGIIDSEAVESGKKSARRTSKKKNANNNIDQNDDVVDATVGGPRVSRKASVSTSKLAKDVQDKQDNFMNTLEVEAQCRLTWEKQPFLCSKFFGSAHSPDVGESGGGGGSGSSSSDYDATYVTEDEDNNDNGYNSQTRRRQRARSLSNVELSMSAGKGYTIFFLRVVPVPPSRFRPPVVMGSLIVEHSQNYYLSKVIELNAQLRTLFNVAHELIREEGELKVALGNVPDDGGTNIGRELKKVRDEKEKTQANSLRIWVDLQTTINCFMDSTRDPRGGKAAASNVPNGIRQLLEKKEGIFRKHMMGKRVNFACRSVISPDPYIGTNEIGLPLYFAKTLTFPTPVTSLNLTEMQKLVRRGPSEYPGAVWVEFPNGQRIDLSKMKERGRDAIAARLLSTSSSSGVGVVKVGRQLRDGDMVLMNRQVSLVFKRKNSCMRFQ